MQENRTRPFGVGERRLLEPVLLVVFFAGTDPEDLFLVSMSRYILLISFTFIFAWPIQARSREVPIRIMPLGDSITKGCFGKDDPRLPGEIAGYRLDLYLALNDAGVPVDFVGSLSNGEEVDPNFDPDHEGHGGFTSREIGENVYQWLMANPADYVLLHIGTNGISADPCDVSFLLDEIDRFEIAFGKQVHVILARIINHRDFCTKTYNYNSYVMAMAAQRIREGDLVTIVDMESALDAPQYFYSNIHPSTAGYSRMAEVWLDALLRLLIKRAD
jgi:lysophospholipase L1-like esterase